MPLNLLTKLEICGFWGPTLVSLTENFEILFTQYRPGGILDVMANNVAVLCHLIIWRKLFSVGQYVLFKTIPFIKWQETHNQDGSQGPQAQTYKSQYTSQVLF